MLLLLIGLGLQLIGGRPFDIAWLLVTLVACAVLVVGAYRHQDSEQ